MDKEAQLVCIHSSFSKSLEIVNTRELEQYGRGGGGILDQDVIHYDAWIRKHRSYAFTRFWRENRSMPDMPAASGAVQTFVKIGMPESLKGSLHVYLFKHSRGETVNSIES
jgi:hypothetical protein